MWNTSRNYAGWNFKRRGGGEGGGDRGVGRGKTGTIGAPSSSSSSSSSTAKYYYDDAKRGWKRERETDQTWEGDEGELSTTTSMVRVVPFGSIMTPEVCTLESNVDMCLLGVFDGESLSLPSPPNAVPTIATDGGNDYEDDDDVGGVEVELGSKTTSSD